ncbi:aromatic amino acid aminotransferase [Candidatus Woesearchaeota archaeon CG10_big_fil_rev_8_21_14_0_10_37_12]|nr:MAG: aromatic amino acid aminotransferase [Candidatus Woesearchaeota archaeon CG10_big_fil_rev_8_21_14_0_10_37_12]
MVHISEREEQLPDLVIERLLELMTDHPEVLSLGPGEPDFSLPKPLVSEIKKLANQSNHYSTPGGLLELREAICKKLKKENDIKANPENVVVTSGSQEALLLATATTLDVSEEILLPNPSYMAYLPTVEIFNAVPKFFQLREENAFEPNPDEIKKQINERKTKVLLINSPANPTGNVIRKKVLEELADLAVEYDLAIFSDEAYEYILYDDVKHISIGSLNGMSDRVFTFQTMSKSYAMCGFRLGYVAAPEQAAKGIKKMHVEASICAPTISQKLAVKALQLPKKYVHGMVKEYQQRRDVIVPRLNELGLMTPVPKGAFYAFSNISHISKNSKKFAFDLLKKQKVAAVPGIDFGSAGEGYMRFSFATKLSIIEKALNRLEKFISQTHR